jgi:hypothetical protein
LNSYRDAYFYLIPGAKGFGNHKLIANNKAATDKKEKFQDFSLVSCSTIIKRVLG